VVQLSLDVDTTLEDSNKAAPDKSQQSQLLLKGDIHPVQ
jgi:hypothetical protein